jgi:hypothetical protein
MKKIFLSTIALAGMMTSAAYAQYDSYAPLFGRTTANGGTARYTAIGGAGTSLGADMGAAYVNPAGLGMYRKSEFTFTPNFGFSNSNTSFLGENEKDNKGSFSISNIGIALSNIKDDIVPGDWRGGTFSITMNRTNSFHNKISLTGVDAQNSMADYFTQAANGTPYTYFEDYESPFNSQSAGITSLGGLAYWSYLITPEVYADNQYYNDMQEETVLKEATYTTKGAQYQWNAAYGASYKDRLYIGGGIGLSTINFREDLSYTESVGYSPNNKSDRFISYPDTVDYFTFNDYNKVKGTGVNLKLGYIYKISDVVRIGTTITTPTFYWMNQEYNSELSVTYDPNITVGNPPTALGTQAFSTTPGYFKFYYTTPLKVSQGLSIFAGKHGFITADVEYIPYHLSDISGRNSADDKFLKPYNKIISNSYKGTFNFRTGAELRLSDFRLRGGFAYLPSPYVLSDGINRDIMQISGGVGARLDNMYIDLGIVNTRYNSSYKPYSLSNQQTATAQAKNSLVNVLLTFGFYFE